MESRAKWTDVIKGVGLEIHDMFDQGDDLYTPGIENVMKVTTGIGAQRNFTGNTGFSDLQKFDDGDDIPIVTRDKTYTTSVNYVNYGGAVQITKNQIQDRDFGSQLDEMRQLSKKANFKTDKTAMQLFNGGFATTTTVNGASLVWYNDGVPQFSTVHPTVVAGASTQSNASSTGIVLSHDNFETARLNVELQQADNGDPLTMAGKLTLVIPMILEKTGKETFNSDLEPETANNNINVFKGTTDMVVSKFLDSTNDGSNTAWYITNRNESKLFHEVRQAKVLEQDINILNKVTTFTVDARWIDYSLDWRATYGSKGDLAAYSS